MENQSAMLKNSEIASSVLANSISARLVLVKPYFAFNVPGRINSKQEAFMV